MRLICAESGLLLEAGNVDDGCASSLVKVPFTGEPLHTAFDPGYLLDGLTCLGKNWARLQFVASTRPAIFDNPEDPTFQYLLMPVRLAG